MQVAVIGAGYVGLVQAAGLASLGHRVRVGERDRAKLELLAQGHIPFYEAELESLVNAGVANGLLSFHYDNHQAVEGAVVIFIALPTPDRGDGSADTSYIETALDEIGPQLEPGTVIALKSTVPVGSVRAFQHRLSRMGANGEVISNPEFLREGTAVGDFLKPDRIVIGTRHQAAVELMLEVYQGLQAPVLVTDPVSAEMIKYASNAYLATRITFANAIANLCEQVGADSKDVLHGMGYDRRIGFHFLNPGPGYGGSCFPKDTNALVAIADGAGYDFSLLRGVIQVNSLQRARIISKVEGLLGQIQGKTIAVWGLAFKAGTDDVRESPAALLARELVARGGRVTAYDPKVLELAGVEMAPSALEAAKGADLLLIATEWPEFQGIDPADLRQAMEGDAVVDARNLLDPATMRALGFRYTGVGR